MNDLPGEGSGGKIAFFVHVHYPEIWETIRSRIERTVAVPFYLYVTTSSDLEITKPDSAFLASMKVMRVLNRGRDILPFLEALAVAEPFDIGLKLHTKKSPQRADGARWLADLLEALLPSPEGVRDILGKLRDQPNVGLTMPKDYCLPVGPWVLVNRPGMDRAMAAVGHILTEENFEDTYFAAGSMFWFRRGGLQALASRELRDLFEPEEGQLDGTIAHAMERIFPVEAKRQGFLSVALPALMQSEEGTTQDQLKAATRICSEEPSPLFPAPYVSPASAQHPVEAVPALPIWLVAILPAYRALPLGVRKAVRSILGR